MLTEGARTGRSGALAQEADHGLATLEEHFGCVHGDESVKRFRSTRSAVGVAKARRTCDRKLVAMELSGLEREAGWTEVGGERTRWKWRGAALATMAEINNSRSQEGANAAHQSPTQVPAPASTHSRTSTFMRANTAQTIFTPSCDGPAMSSRGTPHSALFFHCSLRFWPKLHASRP